MADKDREDAEAPSLEMPSLGGMLRRRKGKEPAGQEPEDRPAEPVGPEPRAEPEPVVEPEPVAEPETSVDTAAVATRTQSPGEVDDANDDVRPATRRRGLGLPRVPARAAAAVTGAVVGLLAVGLTWLGLQGCDLVRGTQSCGGIGLLMLLLILVAMVVLGALMLRAWRIPDATSTSVLAVGLVAVICLLFLVDALTSTWMLLVIPLVGAATYVLAHAVTAKFAETDAG
jgi:hypothetical protein